MPNTTDGWSNWEDQLNRKTQRRRNARARHACNRHRAAVVIELLLFAVAATLMALEAFGVLPAVVAFPLTALLIVFMSFCAGFVCGAKNY